MTKDTHLSYSNGPIHINLDRQLYSKNHTRELTQNPEVMKCAGFFKRMFQGAVVNATEHRAAGHWSLRVAAHPSVYPNTVALQSEGRDELQLASDVQSKMVEFVNLVRSGAYTTPEGLPYQHILHLGIGGSDLGPRLLHDVFSKLGLQHQAPLDIQFVANVDYHEMQAVLDPLDPKRTLVILASKSFSTKETLLNASHILDWLDTAGPSFRQKALVAATCKPAKAAAFGVPENNIFEFSETVGGRYSLWSPVSIGIRMVFGNAVFDELLLGAAHMDAHVLSANPSDCLPILLAATDHYNLKQGITSLMLSPYDARLGLLVPYLQQLWMESLGKGVSNDGHPLSTPCCPILWGDIGTNSQHAFFQMLHQGRNVSSIEILAVIQPDHDKPHAHRVLHAHALAQAEAFHSGRFNTEEELNDSNINFKTCLGKRPVQMMFVDKLSPYSLGSLLCLWEHRTCALGAMQNINPFDQWGVELGKVIAEQIEPSLQPTQAVTVSNPVTAHLIERFLR
jgi:glucose-6-phosphate isomerase